MAINKKDYINKIKTNLYSNKTYSIFYYDFTQDSKRYRGLIDLSDKKGWNKRDKISVAEAELIKIKNEKKNDIVQSTISLNKFMNKHFNLLPDTGWTTTKKRFYQNYIKQYIGHKKMIDIKQMDIKDVLKKQEEKNLAPRTRKQTLEVLYPAFREAIANRIINYNPLVGVSVKVPKQKKIVTNASDRLLEIYNVIVDVFKDDPYYQSLFLFGLQGRRKSEILTLKWEDISFENDYYILRDTKNDETQKMYLPDNIKKLLLQFKEETNVYVYTSRITGDRLKDISWIVDNKLKPKLGSDFGIHYLRNVISSAMAEEGLEAIYQSGALGHNDPNTVVKYLTMNYLKGSEMASNVIDGIVNKED